MDTRQNERGGKVLFSECNLLHLGIILFVTFAAHGLLLLNDGLYSDDFLTYHWLKEGRWDVQFFAYNYSYRPIFALLQWILTYIPLDINFQARLVNFSFIFLAGCLVYGIGVKTRLLTPVESLIVALLSLTYPAFQWHQNISQIGLAFCYSSFLAGIVFDVLALRAPSTKKYYLCRFLSVTFSVFSLMHSSLIAFYFGYVLFRLLYTVNLKKRGEYATQPRKLVWDILLGLAGTGMIWAGMGIHWAEIKTPPLPAFRAVFLYLGMSLLMLPLLIWAERGIQTVQNAKISPWLRANCDNDCQLNSLIGLAVGVTGIAGLAYLAAAWFGFLPLESAFALSGWGVYAILCVVFLVFLLKDVLRLTPALAGGAVKVWRKIVDPRYFSKTKDGKGLRGLAILVLHEYSSSILPLLPMTIVPLVFWRVTRDAFPSNEWWQSYYQVNLLESIPVILQRYIPMFWKNGIAFHLLNALKFGVMLLPLAFIIYFLIRKMAGKDKTEPMTRLYGWGAVIAAFVFGLILLLFGILPYTLVLVNLGSLYDTNIELPPHGTYTRYAQLLGLPMAVILFAAIRALRARVIRLPVWMVLTFGVIITSFCFQNVESYFLWQARWVMDRSVMVNLSSTPEFFKNQIYNIYKPFGNDLGVDLENWFVYSTMFWMICGGE